MVVLFRLSASPENRLQVVRGPKTAFRARANRITFAEAMDGLRGQCKLIKVPSLVLGHQTLPEKQLLLGSTKKYFVNGRLGPEVQKHV